VSLRVPPQCAAHFILEETIIKTLKVSLAIQTTGLQRKLASHSLVWQGKPLGSLGWLLPSGGNLIGRSDVNAAKRLESLRRDEMNKITFVILIAAFLITACSSITKPTQIPASLNIRAYLDGRSELIIQGDVLYWHHLDFDAPGRWELGEVQQPTYLNQTAWEPAWPDIPDATNDSCNCNSSTAVGVPSLARTEQRAWLDIVQGRGRVSVVQQPGAENDYTLVLELDDNAMLGAEWYEVNLNYIVDESAPLTAATAFPSNPTATPTAIVTPGTGPLASISGRILLETGDPFLRVYARNMVTGAVTWINPGEGSFTYTIPDLEPGVYVVVGWFHPMGASGAYTTLDTVIAEGAEQMNACEEALIRIELAPGEAYSGADIGCWGGDFFGLTE
jgi:hypothetical protein